MAQKSASTILHIQALDDSERAWLATVLSGAGAAGLTRGISALSDYFEVERAWIGSVPRARRAPADVVNRVAIALGEALVTMLGMRWAMVSGPTLTELAIVADQEKVVIYPVKAVERCLTRDLEVSIEEYFDSVVERVDGIRSAPRVV